jgi:uncharacterized protein YndB with AHSA1/START domain
MMQKEKDMSTTTNSRVINAQPKHVYHAFTDPRLLERWLAPGDMTAKVHDFDLRVGGGYEMSLYYPDTDEKGIGKTKASEDRFNAVFQQLIPGERIVQTIRFDSSEEHFKGAMTMDVTLQGEGTGTRVTIVFNNIPAGIRPEDNKEGTELSLQKLADLFK